MAVCLDLARSLFDYNPDTGLFIWKVRRGPAKVGSVAGSLNGDGYRQLPIGGVRVSAQRLAFMMYHNRDIRRGMQIDHINGVRDDNRISNLREATPSENQRNIGIRRHNTTGFRGVHLTYNGKYLAKISGKKLGVFDTAKEASVVYEEHAKKRDGEFYKAD